MVLEELWESTLNSAKKGIWRIVCNIIRMYRSCFAVQDVLVRRSFGGAWIGKFANISKGKNPYCETCTKTLRKLIANLFTCCISIRTTEPMLRDGFCMVYGGRYFHLGFCVPGEAGGFMNQQLQTTNDK